MFSSLYEPLPDLDKAMERIGCAGLEIRHDEETLDKLVNSFLTHIPYENLDVSIMHLTPSLASRDLYDKIVTRRRGGYCFEMNGFMWLILRDLGFRTYSVSCYVLEYKSWLGDLGHRANVVESDGRKYLVDVGFGGKNTAAFAVPLDGTVKNGFFIQYDEDEREYTLCREVDEKRENEAGHGDYICRDGNGRTYIKIILFRDFKAYPQEFYLPNLAVSQCVKNHMTENIIVNLRNEKGEVYTMFNDEFRGTDASGSFERKVENEEERKEILKTYYGMNI